MERGTELSDSGVEGKGALSPILFLSVGIVWWYPVVVSPPNRLIVLLFVCVHTHTHMLVYRLVLEARGQPQMSSLIVFCLTV